jgi:hypothetical protein
MASYPNYTSTMKVVYSRENIHQKVAKPTIQLYCKSVELKSSESVSTYYTVVLKISRLSG